MLKNDLYENLVHYWARKDKAYVERSFKFLQIMTLWCRVGPHWISKFYIGMHRENLPKHSRTDFVLLLNNVLCPLFPLSYICKLENVNTCTYMLNFSVLHELLVHLHLYSELSSQAKNMAKACSVYHICLPSVHLIHFSFSFRELFRTC